MSIDTFLYQNPVFTHSEFLTWKLKQQAIQSFSINMALQYYQKIGKIVRVRRELYLTVPPGELPEHILADAYGIAAKAAPDSVLAYHTALEFHGIAYSAFSEMCYLTIHKNKLFEFQGIRYCAVTPPKALKKNNSSFLFIETINRQGTPVRVTSLARTFVDALDRPELSGGPEEICRAINNMAVLNIQEAVSYCLLLENSRLAGTVGYFLEQRKGAFAPQEADLLPLLKMKPKKPLYVFKQKNEKYQLIKKWNILLPLSVINQAWEEPNVII